MTIAAFVPWPSVLFQKNTIPADSGWARIPSPNSIEGRSAEAAGRSLPQMPQVKNKGGEIKLMGSPLTVDGITCWYRSKQNLLAGSSVSLIDVRERVEHLSAAAADFNGPDTMGRINGWVSGEFDFEAVRVSDGEDIFWRHVTVVSVDALEGTYAEFLLSLLNAGSVAALPPSRDNQKGHDFNES